MKIIDKDGKLFNVINLFDLLIMCLFVFILFSVYFGIAYPRTVSRIITGRIHYEPVAIKVILEQNLEWIYDSILTGDVQKGRFNKVIAEISGKKWEYIGEKKYAVIEFNIQAQAEVNGILTYYGRIVKPGERFTFESDRIKLSGFIKEKKKH